MHLITTQGTSLPPGKQKAVLRNLPQPFTLPDVSRHIALVMPHWLDHRAGRLAEMAIREWRDEGRIEAAGSIDSLPAWRRAA